MICYIFMCDFTNVEKFGLGHFLIPQYITATIFLAMQKLFLLKLDFFENLCKVA